MLIQKKIQDDNQTVEYINYCMPDFEYVDPIEHYSTTYIGTSVSMMRDMISYNQPPYPIDKIEKIIFKRAINELNNRLCEIRQTKIPENLIALLTASSKNDQVKLLKNLSITPDQLLAFIFRIRIEFGFLYSQYTVEHHHKGLNEKLMPKIVEIKNDIVTKLGKTTLTDGQLKQAVDHRKVIVSKFLDRGSEWHCLFLTYDSLKGKESWKDGQPHYHYISNKFGLSRAEVVKRLKSKKYNLGNLPHIDLIDYRDKKLEKKHTTTVLHNNSGVKT